MKWFTFIITLFVSTTCTAFDLDDAFKFGLGAGSALIAHEAGHQFTGNGELTWSGTEWRCEYCDAERVAVNGFYTQAIVSEAIARSFTSDDKRWFRNGVRMFNVVQPIQYALRGDGDLKNFTPDHRRQARRALILFALWSAWHFEF